MNGLTYFLIWSYSLCLYMGIATVSTILNKVESDGHLVFFSMLSGVFVAVVWASESVERRGGLVSPLAKWAFQLGVASILVLAVTVIAMGGVYLVRAQNPIIYLAWPVTLILLSQAQKCNRSLPHLIQNFLLASACSTAMVGVLVLFAYMSTNLAAAMGATTFAISLTLYKTR